MNPRIHPNMNPNDPNVVLLELVAKRLSEKLREELVFVGGAVAAC